MDTTNCLNCGGVLDKSGFCPYCGTTYKRINDIEQFIQTRNGEVIFSSNIYINISFKDQDNRIYILPVTGKFSDITMERESINCYGGLGNKLLSFPMSSPKIYISFEGYLREKYLEE